MAGASLPGRAASVDRAQTDRSKAAFRR